MSQNIDPVSAIILSGGQGRRMSNKDKGLQIFNGKMLIQHTIDNIKNQVDDIIISHNRNTDIYKKFALPLVSDGNEEFLGPLAGIVAAKPLIKTPLCFICPCDMPNIPLNIVETLKFEMKGYDAITLSENNRTQPLLTLIKTQSIDSIDDFLKSGKRSVFAWLQSLHLGIFEYTGPKLLNINEL